MCFRIDIDVFSLFFQMSLGLDALKRLSLIYIPLKEGVPRGWGRARG